MHPCNPGEIHILLITAAMLMMPYFLSCRADAVVGTDQEDWTEKVKEITGET